MMTKTHDGPKCGIGGWWVSYFISLGCMVFTAATANGLKVGDLDLQPCAIAHAYCGTLRRALDPAGRIEGEVTIYFEFYPHRGTGPAKGTLVATEGGPGYPATLSRDAYRSLFAPLLATHDLVLMDNRGTGKSGAVDCPVLQQAQRWTEELNGACGVLLGDKAPLYSTAYAADDLAAVLAALKVERIDLYGDSYGTYFEQVFAVRHPALLRSIALDGAYPLDGDDYAWYPTYAPAMRDKFDRLCRRSPACSRRPDGTLARVKPVLEALRANPFDATAADSDGKLRHFRADAAMLATVMFASAPAIVSAREFDAAVGAFAAGDRAPLLRLMAETSSAVDSRDPSGDATRFSAGVAIAVMCQDAPQIFDMNLPVSARLLARDDAIARRKQSFPDTYAPFTLDEYRAIPLDYGFIDQCARWPAPPGAHPASQVVPGGAPYPDIPALIISGDLDNITTPEDGAAAAARFPHGHQVLIENGFHVNALPHGRSDCGARLVRHFIETLDPGDTGCRRQGPALRLVSAFAVRAAELAPATALAGNHADEPALRVAAAVLESVADVLARLPANSSGAGVGLRGGRFVSQAGRALRLRDVRWTQDVNVSGSVQLGAGRSAPVDADVEVASPQGRGRLHLHWVNGGAPNTATIDGVLGGAALKAAREAP